MNSEIIVDCVQGDTTWFEWHLGSVTASRVADVIAKYKAKNKQDGEMACRRDRRYELATERLTGRVAEHFVSKWMQEGLDKEPLARAEYEQQRDTFVEQVGFVCHPTIKHAGCSPDGLVGETGLLEIKCPKPETHLEYMLNGTIPDDYLPQMLWQLACCPDRQWNDFCSFHPDFPADEQLFIKRLERTPEVNALIAAMELETEKFLGEVDEMLLRLKEQRARALETV